MRSRRTLVIAAIGKPKFPKGGDALVKKVLKVAGVDFRTALVVLGWTCFFSGLLVLDAPLAQFALLAIARVLP